MQSKATVQFTVPGLPTGKGRPRFNRESGRAFTPERTVNFENLVKLEYERQCGTTFIPKGSEIGIRVEAYFPVAKSKSKRVRNAMLAGDIRHTSKPDADNLLKAVGDALNGIAYADDSAIVYAIVTKKYAEIPHTDVTIWEARK